MTTTATDQREALVEGLARFVEFLRGHPEVEPPHTVWTDMRGTPAEVKAAVEAFVHGAEGNVTKEESGYSEPKSDIRLIRRFGDLRVWLDFSKESLGCQKVVKMMPVEAYECGPILDAIKEKG